MSADRGDGQFGETTLLLRKCVDGSLQARDDLHRHIFNRVRAIARAELAKRGTFSSAIDAYDVQQEVQAKLDQVLKTKPPEGSPGLWKLISMITPQVLIDLYRKASCRPTVLENQLTPLGSSESVGPVLDRGTIGDDPEKLAEWTEFHQRALSLPEPQGVAFRLIWYKVMPRAEVAQLLQVTEKSVFNYFKQALDELRPYAPVA